MSSRTPRARPAIALLAVAVVGGGAAAARGVGGRHEASATRGVVGVRPDRTFGGGTGFVRTPIAGTFALAYGAVVAAGGKIVVAGQASPPSGNGQVLVARYLPNGRLDRSFARAGLFESALPVADAPFIATAVSRIPGSGKLIVAGGFGQGSILVMRLTPGGRLDPSFGAARSGFVTLAVGGIANSVAIARDGKIVVGGSDANLNGRPFVVARFMPDGALDRTFGRGGIARALFWNPTAASSAGVVSLATTPDGGVIAAGHIDYIGGTTGNGAGHGSAGVFRLTRSGVPFTAFGTRGHAQVTFFDAAGVPRSWFPCAMTRDDRGRITVTGAGGTRQPSLLTARLTSRGVLDRAYGTTGRAVTPGVGSGSDTTCGATSTRAGAITAGAQSDMVALRADGRPDTRFARRGVLAISHPRGVFINAVASSGPHRVVLAGYAGRDIYVARYLLPAGRRH